MTCDPLHFGDPQAYQGCLANEQLDQLIRLEEYIAHRDVTGLANALRETEAAHHAYEQKHGLDTDWPTWYAKHLLGVV